MNLQTSSREVLGNVPGQCQGSAIWGTARRVPQVLTQGKQHTIHKCGSNPARESTFPGWRFCPDFLVSDNSPTHSLSRDRQAEISFCQGSSLAEISSSSAFHDLAGLPLKREISPLDTPKEKRK